MGKSTIYTGSNAEIREAIQRIAWKGVVNKKGTVLGQERISGFVKAIHTDGDLIGTIDVQEYNDTPVDSQGNAIGLHEGVFLSALQNNDKGYVIIPKMYSDVVIAQDPETKREYVVMFSHVDMIQLDSHDKIAIEVKEREEFDPEDENGDDVDELQETGVHAKTEYQKDSIVTDVTDGEDNTVTQTIEDSQFEVEVNDNDTKFHLDKDKVEITHDDGKILADSNKVEVLFGNSKVKVEDGTVHLGSDQNTDDAVLGGELADILVNLLNYIGSIQVLTKLGPQQPMNVAQFAILKQQINAYKQAHSGFLTNKVKVQK